MNLSWKIIFALQKGTPTNAQAVYSTLLRTALEYRYGNQSTGPISDKDLTGAIFDLNVQDQLVLTFDGFNKKISGQDLKELFIASVYLKHLEMGEYPNGTGFFVVMPNETNSCDVHILVSKPEDVKIHDKKMLKLSANHDSYPLQIKEYFNYRKSKEQNVGPEPVDISRLEKLVAGYEELTVVFMRELVGFRSMDLDTFYKSHPKTMLIAIPYGTAIPLTPPPGSIEKPRLLPLSPDKQNFLITFSSREFSIVSFDKPPFLRR